jgi:hypothetical protein
VVLQVQQVTLVLQDLLKQVELLVQVAQVVLQVTLVLQVLLKLVEQAEVQDHQVLPVPQV